MITPLARNKRMQSDQQQQQSQNLNTKQNNLPQNRLQTSQTNANLLNQQSKIQIPVNQFQRHQQQQVVSKQNLKLSLPSGQQQQINVNESQSFFRNLIETPPFSPERRQKEFQKQVKFGDQRAQSSIDFNQENNMNSQNLATAENQSSHFLTFNQNSIEKQPFSKFTSTANLHQLSKPLLPTQNSQQNYKQNTKLTHVSSMLNIPNSQQNNNLLASHSNINLQNIQAIQNMDEIRKSIILRESKQNSCLNQGCLQTECCLLEANRTIQSLRQQIDDIYLMLLDKEGMLIEKDQVLDQMKEKLKKYDVTKEEKDVQTSEDFKLIFSPHNQDTGDTISSVQLDDTLQRKRSKVTLKTQKYHQPKLMINDKEVLSPEHFRIDRMRNGRVMESQIPLDIKFSLVYDESIQDIEQSDNEEEYQQTNHQDYNDEDPSIQYKNDQHSAELFNYSKQEEETALIPSQLLTRPTSTIIEINPQNVRTRQMEKNSSSIERNSQIQYMSQAQLKLSTNQESIDKQKFAIQNGSDIQNKQFVHSSNINQVSSPTQNLQPSRTVKELLGKTQNFSSKNLVMSPTTVNLNNQNKFSQVSSPTSSSQNSTQRRFIIKNNNSQQQTQQNQSIASPKSNLNQSKSNHTQQNKTHNLIDEKAYELETYNQELAFYLSNKGSLSKDHCTQILNKNRECRIMIKSQISETKQNQSSNLEHINMLIQQNEELLFEFKRIFVYKQ
eukprot:403351950